MEVSLTYDYLGVGIIKGSENKPVVAFITNRMWNVETQDTSICYLRVWDKRLDEEILQHALCLPDLFKTNTLCHKPHTHIKLILL